MEPKRWIGVCACGHDEREHDIRYGPYVRCSMPGCKCTDRNYIRSKEVPREKPIMSPNEEWTHYR
jgi:predicted SAM-dependent methyltransferase